LAQGLARGGPPGRTVEEPGARPLLVHTRLIGNQPECYRCHGAEERILGGLVVKMGTERTRAAIAGLRHRIFLIGLLGIGAIIGLTFAILSQVVTGPLGLLARRMRQFPARLDGTEAEAPVDPNRTDEIGHLLAAFAEMTREIQAKEEAVHEANRELAAANRELEAFAYSVSHDLRAPLRNIDGFAKILLDEYAAVLDDRGRHYLDRVRYGTDRMAMLIDDMLTFSRAGRVELHLRPAPANIVVNNALRDFADVIRDRDIEIKVAELPTIRCDQVLMQRVMANLIANAIKYTRPVQRPRIDIGFSPEDGAIFVRDNGIGFDMQYHDKIFHVFQRLHLPEEYEGTGVGLAVVKRIIDRHHGAVWAQSAPGAGAVFFVQVPLAETEAEALPLPAA
ncbi:MAG: ATP-binding protein, partial [Thermodesulfobacteriota bacterium]